MKIRWPLQTLMAVVAAVGAGWASNRIATSTLEAALPGVIGAIVGGVFAGLAFLFAVLTKMVDSHPEKEDSRIWHNYLALTKSLRRDVKLLVWCLAASLGLPFLRQVDVPLVNWPGLLTDFVSKNQAVTATELFVAMMAISVLLEICDCMFQALTANATADQP